ncbi:MAG: DUF4856 domain-containing protein [Myxococcota bacterium]
MFRTRPTRTLKMLAASLALVVAGVGCGEDDGGNNANNDNGELQVPETYEFESRFTEGESSVSYSGQVFRQVLVADLKGFIGGMSDDIDAGDFTPADDGDVIAALDFYFRFDSESNGDTEIGISTDPDTLQTTYNDISSGKDLVGKFAGNDDVTDHKDWSSEFVGWSDDSIAQYGGSTSSPEGLMTAFFETIEENAIARANGTTRTGPGGETLPVYVTESGVDLQQFADKFTLMAVGYSQGTDDYLDSGTDGKGLEAPNTQDGDAAYSSLEHQWDEGFGYFGAARDYLAYTDEEVADPGYMDTDGDGAIDLLSEYNFSPASYAAKRDLGAVESTDFTTQAAEAFLTGRAIITSADGELSAEQMTALEEQRDLAVMAWEKTMAANVVHYINGTLQLMNSFGTDDYDFLEHATQWSEAKAFALGLQFNPRMSLSDADFAELHELLGDAPVLADADQADIDQYKADLVTARQLIGDAHGFAEANLGDDNGEGGW